LKVYQLWSFQENVDWILIIASWTSPELSLWQRINHITDKSV